MDDVTNERLRRLEERLTKVEDAVAGMEERLAGKLENVARGFSTALDAAATGLKSHSENLQRQLHAESMRKFQDVIAKAEEAGAALARLEARSDLEARLGRLEAALWGGHKQ
jgi:hypothetical protein